MAEAHAEERYTTFEAFFPFYLREHSNATNRWMHFVGTSLAVANLIFALTMGPLWLIALSPIVGYGFAWVGHFFVEKNKPASFKYPLWSFMGDFKMYYYMLTGKV